MKIYFHREASASIMDAKNITKYLKQAGVDLLSDQSAKAKQNNVVAVQPLEKVNALIVQAKKLDAQSGYLIALALTQNKHVLCLLPQNTRLDASMDELKNNSKYLSIQFYDEKNLPDKIFDFLKFFDKSSFNDVVNIKYTLRLSSRISDYLDWKSKTENMPKADWLRDKIKDMMKLDKEYNDFLKNKFDLEKK